MTGEQSIKRRTFLKSAISFGTMTASDPLLLQAAFNQEGRAYKEGHGFTFLFQGDSITDGNRSRNNDWNHVMGHGYQYILSSKLWYDFPQKGFRFFNRGVSGNKVSDLAARWQTDTLDVKPDLLSILIGINDVSAWIDGYKDFSVDEYEEGYRALLEQTRQRLPDVHLVLCEPFILRVGKINDKWEEYLSEVQKRQTVVRHLATEYNGVHVPFQSAFDKALSKASAEYWIWDGIHPMPAGHELMAREWMNQVGKKLRFIKPA